MRNLKFKLILIYEISAIFLTSKCLWKFHLHETKID